MGSSRRNLKDPKVTDFPKRVSTLETQSPNGFSSVTRGTFRIASDEGLLVEGQAHVTGLLSGTGEIDWSGPGTFTGDVEAQKFSAGVGAFRTTFDNRGFTSVGTGTRGAIGGGGEQSFSYEGRLNGSGFVFETTGEYESEAWFGAGSVRVSDLPSASSPTSLNVLLINSDGQFYRGPTYSSGGSGGDPGGGGDNPKGLIYPFPLSEAGDRWGPRDYAPSPFHRGIDWPKPAGTGIPCSGDGTVIMAENTGDLWGNYIRVDHGDGIWTAYAHMQPGGIYVSVGQAVTRGQIIGGVGTTGPSTGNHLHFEVWIGGERVDPEGYIGPE